MATPHGPALLPLALALALLCGAAVPALAHHHAARTCSFASRSTLSSSSGVSCAFSRSSAWMAAVASSRSKWSPSAIAPLDPLSSARISTAK